MRNWGSWEPRRDRRTAITFATSPFQRQILKERCDALEQRIRSQKPAEISRGEIDITALHILLFDRLVPELDIAIGNFRGTVGTVLEFAERVVHTRGSQPGLNNFDPCTPPSDVQSMMNRFQLDLDLVWDRNDPHTFIADLARLTFWFFHIHPFLDGNGHVWRAVILILAHRTIGPVSENWYLDPSPYGPDLSFALQQFERNSDLLERVLDDLLEVKGCIEK